MPEGLFPGCVVPAADDNAAAEPDITRSVIISHPSPPLVCHQTTLALAEAGLLRCHEMGLYHDPNGRLERMLAYCPARLADRVRRQLRRKVQEGIAPAAIRSHPFLEVAVLLAARIMPGGAGSESLLVWRNEAFDAAVARHVVRSKPKAVLCFDSSALKTFAAAKQTGTLRILCQIIGHLKIGEQVLQEEFQRHPEYADPASLRLSGWMLERCTQEALAADRVLAPSDYVRDTLIAIGVPAERIAVLPYGADVQRFRPEPDTSPRPFRILFMGQISARKGVHYLLEACKRLDLPDAELVLMGQIAVPPQALRPYEDVFRHVQHVPYAELHRYYQQADIFVFPSLHEGSALVIYEALASGLPVITTRNAGSIVRDGEEGFIVPAGDVDALMAKILLLYQDRELRQAMGRKARQRVECFTWQDYRRRLADLLKRWLALAPN